MISMLLHTRQEHVLYQQCCCCFNWGKWESEIWLCSKISCRAGLGRKLITSVWHVCFFSVKCSKLPHCSTQVLKRQQILNEEVDYNSVAHTCTSKGVPLQKGLYSVAFIMCRSGFPWTTLEFRAMAYLKVCGYSVKLFFTC